MRRRNLLKTLALGVLAASLPAVWFARERAFPPVRRYGRHYLVGGWVVTARDLEAMRRHDA